MERSGVQKLARVLRLFVLLVFILNLLVLPLVPGLVGLLLDGGPDEVLQTLRILFHVNGTEGMEFHPLGYFAGALVAVWTDGTTAVTTLFILLYGICTAVLLWQARRVLDTILEGNPFQLANARYLKRASISCWVISGAALVRTILWICEEGNLGPIFTYNTLFVPVFLMGGLLFLVMSALFRQAAEMKEDQDLTI